jgi:hypothetical protein
MGLDKKEVLRQRQLAFVGKMLDGYTQRIPEYLATIQESTGSLDDFLGQASQVTDEDREKFVTILSTIERQVKKLERKSQHLGRFAKRMGTALSTFDPGEVVEEAVSFSTRSAHVQEVTLTPEVAQGLPSLYGDPVRIHFLVSMLIDDMLERVGRGGKIILRTGALEKGVLIEVEGYGTSEALASAEKGNPCWSIGQQVVADFGGRLQTTAIQDDRRRSSLFLPMELTLEASKVVPVGQ